MKTFLPYIILSFFIVFQVHLYGQDRGRSFDMQQYIDTEISKGNANIKIPGGVYRVTPHGKSHLTFKNLKNITIDASQVEMICTQTTRAITFINCENVTLKGLTIDYDPLCFTQGRIIRLSPNKKSIDFKLDDGYPDGLVERIEIFDPSSLTLRRSTYYGWQKFKKIGERTYRTEKGADYRYNPSVDTEQVGDILVTNNEYAPDGSAPHAIYSDYCKNLSLQDITLYSGNCFGYFETNATATRYIRCRIDRRSPETDYVERAQRIRSNDADAFHSKFAFVGPSLIGCSTRFQGDDGLNICGKYYFSTGGKGNKISLVAPHGCDLKKGNVLEILTYDGTRLPLVTIVDIQDGGVISEKEIDAIRNINQNANNKRNLTQPRNKIVNVIVDREINFELGAVVGDHNRMGHGFLVQDCNFSFNRSRGILIKGSDGKIINNVFEENWMPSILISPEAWWLESGCSDNIEVVGNTIIRNKSRCAIDVEGKGFGGNIPAPGLHNNITLLGNKFYDCPSPAIRLLSTQNGKVENNLFSPVLTGDKENIQLENCENIK